MLKVVILSFLITFVVSQETSTPPSGIQELGMARILSSKFLLSQYAVESKEFVVEYKLYNVGDKPALKVSLDDRNGFPTTHFEILKGLLQVRWERIAPGANVTHAVVLKPRFATTFNYSSALVTYLPSEDDEMRISYTTAPGEGYIYYLKDYERKFSPHYTDWAIFALMALPCLALPAMLWFKTKSKYVMEKKSK